MKLLTIIAFEVRKLIRARVVLFNLFLLPLLLIFILGNALSPMFDSGSDKTLEQVNVKLVRSAAEGGTDLGLDAFLVNPEIKETLRIDKAANRAEAEASLRSGNSDFAVVIPGDFEAKVTRGEAAKWEYILGKDQLKNHVAEMIFDAYLDEVNRTQASAIVLGPEAVTAAMRQVQQAGDPTFVEMAPLSEQGESYSAFQYYAVSMLIMFLLYSGLMVNESLRSEIDNRTLYRLGSMPIGGLPIFAGKIIGNGLVTSLQATVIILGTSWLYGVEWGNHPFYLAAICGLVILCSMMLAVIVSLWSKSGATARTLVQVVAILMTFLSGGFQPIPVDLIQRLEDFTVNHWAMQGLLRIMLGADPAIIGHHILMLGIFGGVLMLIGIITYRKAGYHE
ncbi:ABC transporter permease [Paenibacillus sanfengchensis]|uniref:ABC transporter permease n=1 Tax=Paenibacillus sanfengchensis TaxID=3119819 RepID=UPI002FE3FFE3